jgi:hypothetical protein
MTSYGSLGIAVQKVNTVAGIIFVRTDTHVAHNVPLNMDI